MLNVVCVLGISEPAITGADFGTSGGRTLEAIQLLEPKSRCPADLREYAWAVGRQHQERLLIGGRLWGSLPSG